MRQEEEDKGKKSGRKDRGGKEVKIIRWEVIGRDEKKREILNQSRYG